MKTVILALIVFLITSLFDFIVCILLIWNEMLKYELINNHLI